MVNEISRNASALMSALTRSWNTQSSKRISSRMIELLQVILMWLIHGCFPLISFETN